MRDCVNCFHRKPVLKEDGTWTAECEKWDCEFQSRENMIEKTKAMNNDLISRSALKEDMKSRLSACNEWIEKAKDKETKIRASAVKAFIAELIMTIDNAPTVEYTFEEAFQKTVCENKLYCPQKSEIVKAYEKGFEEGTKNNSMQYTLGYQDGVRKVLSEKPKGEWIETQRGIHVTDYKCSCCGRTVRDDTGYDVASDYPFCNCGAKMRGENK